MDRSELYDRMADRKFKPRDLEPYDGNNGRVNRCVQLIRSGQLRSGGTILDVGGGIGDLGFSVMDLFPRRIVVDISSKNLEAASAKGNMTLHRDIDHQGLWGIEDSSVDLVTALDFIEHIVDPENFARECHRVLKPSGEVFINTPNIQFYKHIMKLIGGTFPHTSGDREVFHGGHLAFFTYDDLRQIFEPAGFTSFEQIKDDEGFEPPNLDGFGVDRPANQREHVRQQLRFGCPNLLYKAVLTK